MAKRLFKWGEHVDCNHVKSCVIAALALATIGFNYARFGFSWMGLVWALICLAALDMLVPDYFVVIFRRLKRR